MAKSSRSSARKVNNRRLKATVFGPVEAARAQRLSAKLLELAKQPKPETSDAVLTDVQEDAEVNGKTEQQDDEAAMEVDSGKPSTSKVGAKRIGKRKQKKNKIVFQKYSDRNKKA